MAHDIIANTGDVTITALSAQPPRGTAKSPHAALWAAFAAAGAAGRSVRIILPPPTQAHPATFWNGHAAQWLHDHQCRAIFYPGSNLLHAKTATIANSIAWVGSGNLTAAAANHNAERWLRVDSPLVAARLAHWQDELINPSPLPLDHRA